MKIKPLNALLVVAVAAFALKHGIGLWEERAQLDVPSLKAPHIDTSKLDTKTHLQRPKEVTDPSMFACDGRTACGQMTSCEEAKFFLTTCPNTQKMDSDQNGIPCEKVVCD